MKLLLGMLLLLGLTQTLTAAERSRHNPQGDDRIERSYNETRDRIMQERARGTPDTSTRDRAETNSGHFNRPPSNYDVEKQQSPYNQPARRP